MPTIRERITDAFLGDEKRKLERTAQLMVEAYADGPFVRSPEALMSELKEYDSAILYDLVNQMLYDNLGYIGYDESRTEQERERAVKESRRLTTYDPVADYSINVWTNFGFGENIEVVIEGDENAQETFDEFWKADRNQRVLGEDTLHLISDNTLIDGEAFLAFYISKIDGQATVRTVNSDEIVEIITLPEDSSTPVYYKRQWSVKGESLTWYYPDWLAVIDGIFVDVDLAQGSIRAEEQKELTLVCMLPIANKRRKGLRGWPLLTSGAPWFRAHKKFREDRASLAAALALYGYKVKTEGGSRATEAMRSNLASQLSQSQYTDTNPPAAAGATWIENQSATLSKLPQGTGAGDAQVDGASLLQMAGISAGLYPHWLGAGEAFRLATATSMEAPVMRQFSRYQKFWSAQFKKMARLVLWAAEKYTSATFNVEGIEVSTDRLVEVDLEKIAQALSDLYRDALTPMLETGVMPAEVAKEITAATWRLALQAMGVQDAVDITSDEAFGIDEETEEFERAWAEVIEKSSERIEATLSSPPSEFLFEVSSDGSGDSD